ncbi:hypothetical protein HNY73_022037 [Argiope bruennichi]|uniref:Uncharacterized protein n=1 Tax=Argiope bruennichi TaxID=94029 RepID=A0A8T0E1A6_ARGBR|nr:hypothetical protein HNY73_022037 [Argiope bruennichi]
MPLTWLKHFAESPRVHHQQTHYDQTGHHVMCGARENPCPVLRGINKSSSGNNTDPFEYAGNHCGAVMADSSYAHARRTIDLGFSGESQERVSI